MNLNTFVVTATYMLMEIECVFAMSAETTEEELAAQAESDSSQNRTEVRIAEAQKHNELYEKSLDTAYRWSETRPAFVRGILREEDLNHRFAAGRTLDFRSMAHEEPGALLIYPDETRVFVGRDETAHTRGDYGFVVKPNDPVPLPESVEEALDLLKPLGVRSQMEEQGELPPRQGEWWLLETDRTPEGSIFKGGVSERPFNGSPLESHVPTEFGFGVEDDVLANWFESQYPDVVNEGDSLQDIFSRVQKATEIEELSGLEANYERPTFGEIREAANGVFIRGTLRHRENDHYMERIGDEWELARTHDMEVYTADNTSASRVRRD